MFFLGAVPLGLFTQHKDKAVKTGAEDGVRRQSADKSETGPEPETRAGRDGPESELLAYAFPYSFL